MLQHPKPYLSNVGHTMQVLLNTPKAGWLKGFNPTLKADAFAHKSNDGPPRCDMSAGLALYSRCVIGRLIYAYLAGRTPDLQRNSRPSDGRLKVRMSRH